MAENTNLLQRYASIQGSNEKPSAAMPLIYALMAALGPLAFGYTLGFTSPIGDHMKDDLNLTTAQQDLFGSMVNVGAMVGALSGGFFLDYIGRRGSIFLCTLPFVGGFLLIKFADSFGMVLAGRLLTGAAVGLASLSVPVYIAEISPAHLRGAYGSINQLAVTIGILVCYAIGLGVNWRMLALIGAMFPAALGVLCLFFPPSPRWLYSKGREEAAARTLSKIRGRGYNIDQEMAEMETADRIARQATRVSLGDLFKGGSGKAMFIALMLMVYQQFSGINVVIFYSGKIFKDAGMSSPSTAALIVGAVQVVVTALSLLVIDKAGRRALLMAAGIGMAATCAVLGYYFFEKNHNNEPSGNIAVVSVILYISCFSFGLGAIPWLMMSEIFPSRVRGLASSMATLFNWTCSFTVTELFSSMIGAFTEEGVFWFYGCICILGVLFVLFYVPETKGRSLEEIERFFNGDKNAGNQHVDGAGTGGALVKIASLLALLFVGATLLFTNL